MHAMRIQIFRAHLIRNQQLIGTYSEFGLECSVGGGGGGGTNINWHIFFVSLYGSFDTP